MHLPEVGNLQRFLNETHYTDAHDQTLVEDESFGPKTAFALSMFQKERGLFVNGCLDEETRRIMISLGFIPFVQAKHFSLRWPRKRVVTAICIHTMECHETKLDAAEAVALWFADKAKGYPAPKASAHYLVDQNSIVQSVRDMDEAWHASQANPRSIGIEHAGFAAQTMEEWSDPASSSILWRSAKLTARLAKKYGIPPIKISPEGVRVGQIGFFGHVDVTVGFGNKGGHTDPGKNFPWASYLALVAENM